MTPPSRSDRRRQADQPRLRMRRMNLQQLRHARSLAASGHIIQRIRDSQVITSVNLQQLKYLCAVVDNGLNVSDAAEALYTSQPGISKQIRQLEDELGLRVFVRQGKRLTSLTPAGEVVVATARRALREIANLKRVADEFRSEDAGVARHRDDAYAGALRAAAGAVEVRRAVSQGAARAAPGQSGAGRRADGGGRRRRRHRDRGARRLSRAGHAALLPVEPRRARAQGPSAREGAAADARGARQAIRSSRTTSRSPAARRSTPRSPRKGLEPNVVLTALDADVIKTYVELGMGVGIVAQMAYDAAQGHRLRDARREPPVRGVDDAARAAQGRVPARLRLRVHHAVRAAVHAPRGRCGVGRQRARWTPCEANGGVDRRMRARCRTGARSARGRSRRCSRRCRCSARSRSTCTCPRSPRSAREFEASPIAVQQTLSAYLFAYAFMMLWHGALSDALGRRPIILGGLAIYGIALAGLRHRRQHRVAVAVSHAAGAFGRQRASSSAARSSATASRVPKRSG